MRERFNIGKLRLRTRDQNVMASNQRRPGNLPAPCSVEVIMAAPSGSVRRTGLRLFVKTLYPGLAPGHRRPGSSVLHALTASYGNA